MTANLPALPVPRVPAHLRPWVEALGADLAAEVFLQLGGAELALSPTSRGDSQLAQLVGQDRAEALARHPRMPAVRCRVPLANRWVAQLLHMRGHGVGEIARRTRVSSVMIARYLKDIRT